MRHNSQQGQRPGRYRGNGGGRGGSNSGGGHRRGGGGGHGGGGNSRMQVFDSNGPEVRIRGTAFQICEKYQALAKDAASMGDRVLEESYLQHAEHYQRVINLWHEANPQQADSFRQEQSAEVKVEGQNADLGLPPSIIGGPVAQKADSTLEDA